MNEKIKEINLIISQYNYFEIEVYEMSEDLVLVGSSDFCYYHNLEIKFKNVFHVNLNTRIIIDNSMPFFTKVEGEEAKKINIMYNVEFGYSIFKLVDEDIKTPFYIIAKEVEYNTDTVFYYKRENLKENERIAEWVLNKPDSSDMTK